MTEWVLHERRSARHQNPGVRVARDGRSLQFNASAAVWLHGTPALLIYRRDNGWVAFEPVDLADRDGFAVSHIGAVAWIRCGGFIGTYQLNKSHAWDLHVAPDGWLIGEPRTTSPAEVMAGIYQASRTPGGVR